MSEYVSYNGKPYKHYWYGYYVNNYGNGVVCYEKEKRFGISQLKFVPWKMNKDGYKMVKIFDKKKRLDEIITRVFGDCNGNYAGDTYGWEIEYLDGNKSHCYVSNLKWVPVKHIKDMKKGMEKVLMDYDHDFWLYENGDAYVAGKKETARDYLYDPDIDLHVALDPQVSTTGSVHDYKNLEGLMIAAGFVKGDKSSFNSPVLLHLDMDWRNCSANNLLWIDSTDSRWTDYLKKKDYDMQALEDELNNGRRYPGSDRTAKWQNS